MIRALCLTLLLACPARADIADAFDAVCRVSTADGGTGTGTAFKLTDREVHILTNAHVADKDAVNVEFWRGGYVSTKYTGRTVLRTDISGKLIRPDVAVVCVDRAKLPVLPRIIPLAPADHTLKIGQSLYSIGCAQGTWPTMFRGHVTANQNGFLEFVPCPAQGRSGSAILNHDGTRIVGLVAWQHTDVKEPYGTAMDIATVRQALAGKRSAITGGVAQRVQWQAAPEFHNHLRDANCPPGSPYCPFPLFRPFRQQPRPQPQQQPQTPLAPVQPYSGGGGNGQNPWLGGNDEEPQQSGPLPGPAPIVPQYVAPQPVIPTRPDQTAELLEQLAILRSKLAQCEERAKLETAPKWQPETAPATPAVPSEPSTVEQLSGLSGWLQLLVGAGAIAATGGTGLAGYAGLKVVLGYFGRRWAAKGASKVVGGVIEHIHTPAPPPKTVIVNTESPPPPQKVTSENHYVHIDTAKTERAWSQAHRMVANKFPGGEYYLKLAERVKQQILAGEEQPEF